MKTVLTTLILFLCFQLGYSQRCGYDYLQAFVVEVVDNDHPNNIPDLKLTLTNEFGQKLEYKSKYPESQRFDFDEQHIETPARLDLPFLKKIPRSNFQEFWENGHAKVMAGPGINQPAHLRLSDNLYVIFITFHYSLNQPVTLPVYQVQIEDPDSIKHFKKFPKRIFRLNPEKSVYLCANHLIGNGEIWGKIYCIDGSVFKPIQLNLSNPTPQYEGKVQKNRYEDVTFETVRHNDAEPNKSEISLKSIQVYSGDQLQLMQKIVPRNFEKFAKKQGYRAAYKYVFAQVFPKYMLPELAKVVSVSSQKKKYDLLSVVLEKGMTISGIQHQHQLFFQYDSTSKQYTFDTILSEYPNLLFDYLPGEICRYEIIDLKDDHKVMYYQLVNGKWAFLNEKILYVTPIPAESPAYAKLVVKNPIKAKNTIIHVGNHFSRNDSVMIVNLGSKKIDLPQPKVYQSQNLNLIDVTNIEFPKFIEGHDTAWIVVKLKNRPLNNQNYLGLPFEMVSTMVEYTFTASSMIKVELNYIAINHVAISDTHHLKTFQYDDEINHIQYKFKENFEGWFWNLNLQNNEVESYGRSVSDSTGILKIGDWYSFFPRKMISHSREIQFEIRTNGKVVNSTVEIFAIRNGQKEKLQKFKKPQFIAIWSPLDIDSFYLYDSGYSNLISNLSYWNSTLSVPLFNESIQPMFRNKYNQFSLNLPYQFDQHQYLLKLRTLSRGETYASIMNELQIKYPTLKISIDHRYYEQYVIANFIGLNEFEIDQLIEKLLNSEDVVGIHQKLITQENREAFFSGNVVVKPSQKLKYEELKALSQKYGFDQIWNQGEGHFTLSSSNVICDEVLFLKAIQLMKHSELLEAVPGFFNPLKISIDE